MVAVVIAVVGLVLSLTGSVHRIHRLFLRRENPPPRSSRLLAESRIVTNGAVCMVVVVAVAVAVVLVAVVAVVGGLGAIVSAAAAGVLSLVWLRRLRFAVIHEM